MPDPEPTKPEERVRRIEEETKHLEGQMSQAAEAVRRALQADSLEEMGTGNTQPSRPAPKPSPETAGQPASAASDESDESDESGESDAATGSDRKPDRQTDGEPREGA
jgi:hypothetical protein